MKKLLKIALWIIVIIAVISIGRACIYGGFNQIAGTSSIYEPEETESYWTEPETTTAPTQQAALPTETAATQAPIQLPVDMVDETAGGYYEQLSDFEKQVYNAIDGAVRENKTTCKTPPLANVQEDREIERAVTAYLMDHPECLDLNGAYTIYSNGRLELDRYDFWRYSARPERYTEALMTRVSEIAAEAKRFDTDFERAVYVHDTICENCSYDYVRLEESEKTVHDPEAELIYNAYGCLVEGKCVCQGYAEAFKLIMDELGIPCYYVTGMCEGENHGWNVVKLGGGYYHVDVTWDDADDFNYKGTAYTGMYDHSYFGLTTEAISVNHTVNNELLSIPECTAARYNYYSYMGYRPASADVNSILQSINAQRSAGDYPIVIAFDSKEDYDIGVSDDVIHELYHEAGFEFIYITDDEMLTLSMIEKKN